MRVRTQAEGIPDECVVWCAQSCSCLNPRRWRAGSYMRPVYLAAELDHGIEISTNNA